MSVKHLLEFQTLFILFLTKSTLLIRIRTKKKVISYVMQTSKYCGRYFVACVDVTEHFKLKT